MDPRTSSKVTAPDLVEAFREGTGHAPEAVADETKLFVLFSMQGKVHLAVEHAMKDFDEVMDQVASWLKMGDGHAVMVVVATEEPPAITKAREAISAASG